MASNTKGCSREHAHATRAERYKQTQSLSPLQSVQGARVRNMQDKRDAGDVRTDGAYLRTLPYRYSRSARRFRARSSRLGK